MVCETIISKYLLGFINIITKNLIILFLVLNDWYTEKFRSFSIPLLRKHLASVLSRFDHLLKEDIYF